MLRSLAVLSLLLATPAAGATCAPEVHQRLADLTEAARAGTVAPESLGEQANEISRACGADRVVLSQIMAMFTVAGIAVEPPSGVRYQEHLLAFRTANRIAHGTEPGFEPVALAAGDWSQTDERDAYWDLMFAMSSDFLTYSVHKDIYTAGVTEQIGCLLYPAEEASALATHALDGADSGELVVRLYFLGANCDGADHATSGQVAMYFANHAHARQDDADYIGLTGGDIRGGLQRFLTQHLAGRESSELFSAEAVTELMAF